DHDYISLLRGDVEPEIETDLPGRHGQVDIGQQLRVDQSSVQSTARVVHAEPLAQGVEAVALARVALPGHRQGIEHAATIANPASRRTQLGQLGIQEADVEAGVVDDQLRAFNEAKELVHHVGETRLVQQ